MNKIRKILYIGLLFSVVAFIAVLVIICRSRGRRDEKGSETCSQSADAIICEKDHEINASVDNNKEEQTTGAYVVTSEVEIVEESETTEEIEVLEEIKEPVHENVILNGPMNGIWVATVGNMDYPFVGIADSETLKAEADRIIDLCVELRINSIFLQVRPCSDAFYKSDIYPWSRYLTGEQGKAPDNDFDPLAYWVDKAHENNIQLHAWVNPYRVTKENDAFDTEYNLLCENNPARLNPEYLIRYNENLYFDPAIPEVREMVIEGIVEIVENYSVDGIHFDDYFYPGPDFPDAASFDLYGTEFDNKFDWRRDNVNKLVEAVGPVIKAINPNAVFGISPSGIWANKSANNPEGSETRGMEAYNQLAADTLKWAKEGWVDYIAPQLYWEIGFEKADYEILANWWADKLSDSTTKLYIGLAEYRTVTTNKSSAWYGENGVNQIMRQLELNETIPKISGVIHFRVGSFFENELLREEYLHIIE